MNLSFRHGGDGDCEVLLAPTSEKLSSPIHPAGMARQPLLEMWGGVECTINRVNDAYFDQLQRSGHYDRASDLDLFARLGIRTLRYPVLWERTAPRGIAEADWRWADARLARLRELGVRPIVGLVHHGSGPHYTSLVDPQFPEKLAEYAGAVAARYPWVEAYTPVNEILTTARFSGLYGHWYPHGRDGRTFAQVLLNECRGTVLAMRAIRRVNPRAQLIQTDDLGKTYSTPLLAYQAEFDNERRWLGWDLLCGRVDRDHPLWPRLVDDGISPAELEWFAENPCPPEVLGVNYYITSQRFLDERLERYPPHTHGGNARDRYADVEAVRVCEPGIPEVGELLLEAWQRYELPLAVTEAHLGCTREEQLRWLLEIWRGAEDLRKREVPILAVTAWSLLGAYDWNSLLTRNDGYYEPGVFDLRGGTPRPTALAGLIRDLASGREPVHPIHHDEGWWRRPERLLYPAVPVGQPAPAGTGATPSPPGGEAGAGGAVSRRGRRLSGQRVRSALFLRGGGSLDAALPEVGRVRGLRLQPIEAGEADLTVRFAVEDLLDTVDPWAIVLPLGVAESCRPRERNYRDGAGVLAAACASRGLPLLVFSSVRVFDGTKESPYHEEDAASPRCACGRDLAEVEARIRQSHPGALIVRSGECFGSWSERNIVTDALRRVREERVEEVHSPTYVPDLVNAALDLLIDGEAGVWHLTHGVHLTPLQLSHRLAALIERSEGLLRGPQPGVDRNGGRARVCRALSSLRGPLLPSLEDALRRYLGTQPAVGGGHDGRVEGLVAWSAINHPYG